MTPDEARAAMMSMYGGHDDAAVAEMSGSGRGGDQLEGINIRDMPGFPKAGREQKGPFVDQIKDDGMAVLLMPDGKTQEVPADRLPRGAREGSYLGPNGVDDLLGEKAEIDGLRGKLSAGDTGGDLKL